LGLRVTAPGRLHQGDELRGDLVASGTGYWRLNAPAIRWRAPLLWLGIAPLATRVAGYFLPRQSNCVKCTLELRDMRRW
jgi:hypothetical protein